MSKKSGRPEGRRKPKKKAGAKGDAGNAAAPAKRSGLPAGYAPFLAGLKERIRAAQVKASLSVNRELVGLYWDIGRSIVERQREEGWGKSVVERLSQDLRKEFQGIAGFSPQNLWYMRAFYLAWTEEAADLQQPVGDLTLEDLQQLVGGLPWGHNLQLMAKVKDPAARLWYARQAAENGWSRAVLVHQIESGLRERQGKALTNFQAALPPPQSDLAEQVLKDPYNFDFLNLGAKVRERDLEQALIERLQNFLLELGKGFAFVGRQYHLTVDGDDYYIDLLFYHLHLRCYVVIDLKVVPFEPEFAGKMNFYLSAVEDQLRQPEDRPSIGLILCKERKRLTVEYALRNTAAPIGVSQYRLTKALPADLKKILPSAKDIEAEVREVFVVGKGATTVCPKCGGRLIELSRDHEMYDLEEDATEGQAADWMAEAESGMDGNYSYDDAEYRCEKCGRVVHREEQ